MKKKGEMLKEKEREGGKRSDPKDENGEGCAIRRADRTRTMSTSFFLMFPFPLSFYIPFFFLFLLSFYSFHFFTISFFLSSDSEVETKVLEFPFQNIWNENRIQFFLLPCDFLIPVSIFFLSFLSSFPSCL